MKKTLLLMLTLLCSVMTWAEEVSYVMKSYDSTNKVYTAKDDQNGVWSLSTNCSTSNQLPADWSQTGASSRGICFSTPNNVTVTSNTSYTNVTKIVVEASSNIGSTTVAHSIALKVGNTDLGSTSLSKTNHTSYEFTSTTPLSGKIVLTINQGANSVWIGGFKVTTSGSDTPATEQYSYTLETVGQGSVVFKDANNNTIAPNQKVDKDTKITPTFTPADGYEFTSWEYYTTAGAWSKLNGNEFTITKDVNFRVTFTETQQGGEDTPTPVEGDKYESGNLGYEAFGLTPEGTSTYAQPDVESNSITFNGINLTLTKNEGITVRFDDTYVRVYQKNTLTITAPEGRKILKVELNKAGGDWKNGMTVSPACATYNDAATTPTWTGNATSVSFTPGGTHRLASVTVYLEPTEDETPSITISAAGVSTYYNSTYSYKMPKGLTGYYVSEAISVDNAGLLTLLDAYPAGVVVPAGEALIIKGAAGTYELEAGTTGYKPYGDNRLKGTDEAATTTGGDVYYKLAKDPESGLGFYWGAENGAAFTNGAHKAYLALTSDEAGVSGAKGFVLNFDEATAISTVKTSVNANVVYNLAGQRVNANAKGIVIMNGKKYLNK